MRPLQDRMIRLRWLRLGGDDSEIPSRWRASLAADERERADRFRFATDRNAFIAAHALVRNLLSEATGRAADSWRFRTGRFGKPAIVPDCDALEFSIAHGRGCVACAIARSPVGVDVEPADRPPPLELIDSFAPSESAYLRSLPSERLGEAFFRLWTLKEAYLKATGDGLHRPLDSFAFTLDPVAIDFGGRATPAAPRDDPARWQFAEFLAAPDRPLALAAYRPDPHRLLLDSHALDENELIFD